METRVAMISIIVEKNSSTERMNGILHEYSNYIIGRMGIPYAKRDISLISIMIDAPNPVISALSGKLGKLPNIKVKALYATIGGSNETIDR